MPHLDLYCTLQIPRWIPQLIIIVFLYLVFWDFLEVSPISHKMLPPDFHPLARRVVKNSFESIGF